MKRRTSFEGYEIRILSEEDGYYAARFPDFPGIITGGHTPEEALRNAQEALTVTLETMRERNIPYPVPKHKFSGQFNVRLPRSLHRALVQKAEEEGVSLNAFVTHLLNSAMSKEKRAPR
ncbi:MAG: type II toxin-antitoxin system HicB family antitoxin [Deltaproteobacteria bacterium]|nr:type II toxin-antitoxin system HicB family antitoxin [Deltaproteobacteria bacterium]